MHSTDVDVIGTALFVGGPRDGELAPLRPDAPERLQAPVYPTLPGGAPWEAPPWLQMARERVRVCEYRREVFHTPMKDFYFWVAEELTPEDLMLRLMTNYHAWKARD